MSHPDLIDIGSNLTHDSFDADRAQVVRRAREAGVIHQIITGATVAGSAQGERLAAEDPVGFSCTVGVHPHYAAQLGGAALPELTRMLASPQVVAVGECGLDYFRNLSPREAQLKAFSTQLELAVLHDKPVFLHQRDAHADFLALLREFRPQLSAGVAHCFTAGPRELEDYLALDLHIGVTGWICDERRGQSLREAVHLIPAQRLMVETDAPYLLPRDIEPRPASRRNEPMYLPHVVRAIAALRGESFTELAALTTANARRFFRLESKTGEYVRTGS